MRRRRGGGVALALALALAGASCGRRRAAGARGDDAGVADAAASQREPVVQCLAYRPCGCARGCAGISVPRADLRVGLTAPVVAGEACGDTARVESALGADGRLTLVLGQVAPCEHRCGLAALTPVDPRECAQRCEGCAR